MPNKSERFATQEATVQTSLSPTAVYRTAADLELLPRWWFRDDPESRFWDGTRVPREVDEAGFVASPGASVDIVSSGAKNEVFGKKRWTETPSVIRFRCTVAEPGVRLHLEHQPIHGDTRRHQVSTELRMAVDYGLTSVTLTQSTVASGRDPTALLARWAQARFDFPTRYTLRDLIKTAEAQTPLGT